MPRLSSDLAKLKPLTEEEMELALEKEEIDAIEPLTEEEMAQELEIEKATAGMIEPGNIDLSTRPK